MQSLCVHVYTVHCNVFFELGCREAKMIAWQFENNFVKDALLENSYSQRDFAANFNTYEPCILRIFTIIPMWDGR